MEFYSPTTVDEAVDLLGRLPGTVKVLAGGTDLAVEQEFLHPRWDALVYVGNVAGLRGIREESGALVLGAATTFAEVLRSPLVQRRARSLVEAARTVGSWAIQVQGTIGGNLATASPAGDGSVALLALGAEATLRGPKGRRGVPLHEFFTGPKRSVLARDELITEVRIPAPPAGACLRGAFLKVGKRRAMAISIVCAAVEVAQGPGGDVLDIGIAYGSVAPTPIRARSAEALLRGKRLTEDVIRRAAAAAAGDTRPIDDVRGEAWYRKEVAAVLVERALIGCMNGSAA
jgi:CO/xanthine dehydrogenase FAD-binding subunit